MPKVLITKNISSNQLRLLMEAGLKYEIETALNFEIDFKTNEVIQTVKERGDWLFTSVNAVKSIQPLLSRYQNKFEQKIYCIGKGAYSLLTEIGYFSVVGCEDEADLQKKYVSTKTGNLTYFCNNAKKKILLESGSDVPVNMKQIQVFTTTLLRPEIKTKNFDFIMYFSPLGVKSILSKNPELRKVNSICTGPTTSKFLKEYGAENCFISEKPNIKSMVDFITKHKGLR